jgi:pSer/pThr/pTyr-binding forkhead associated (FHA) protein
MFEMTISTAGGEVLRRYDLSRLTNGGKRLLIGRADDCDIRIKNGAVSRHHCAIEALEDDEWVLRDLGSTHGSFINGERITEAEIAPGLTVSVGPAILRFDSVASRIAADIAKEISED